MLDATSRTFYQMTKKQPAYFYGLNKTKPERVIVPDSYDIKSKVIEVMGWDGMMHALDGLRYDHQVRLLFRFKTKKAMQETEGDLGDSFKYRSRMFLVNQRDDIPVGGRHLVDFDVPLGRE